jgi:hypothetical protein
LLFISTFIAKFIIFAPYFIERNGMFDLLKKKK